MYPWGFGYYPCGGSYGYGVGAGVWAILIIIFIIFAISCWCKPFKC